MKALLKSKRGPGGLRTLVVFFAAAVVLLFSACERSQWDPTLKIGQPTGHLIGREGPPPETFVPGVSGGISLEGRRGPAPKESMQKGTGTFVHKVTPPKVETKPGDVTLNFDGTDIREVVKVILGDLLQTNYVLHPAVQGVASLQTGRPLRRQDLIPTLETLLRMNGAALVYVNGQYEVVPLANAVQGNVVPQLGDTDRALPEGYSVQIVPLQYIGADEMSKILQPLAPEGSIIRVDNLRNLIVIAATSPEMGNLMDTIRVFDVDWMAGLSVGFFTLEYAKAKDVVSQLENLLADEGGNPFKGVFRFIPVETANSLLVISPQAKYLRQAKDWIERLDLAEASGSATERLYVYRVKHSSAENLAQILTELFGEQKSGAQRQLGSIAPGLQQASIESGGGKTGTTAGTKPTAKPAVASTIQLTSAVSIVADTANNALLVRASPRDYKKILDAIKQLDLVPLQVLVEATIVEITLTGSLRYGVQWQFFGPANETYRGDTSLVDSTTGAIGKTFPGFNWAVVLRPDTIRAVLSALAADNLLNVLSSPSVMVMDNQTAKIQVGKQVPIATQQQQSVVGGGNPNIVNSIQYKDTGVILTVKPRVTPGGLVQLEIEQEVSTVDQTTTGGLDSPTFSTRKITSSVAVRSSQAVVLGGLISDTKTTDKNGVPGAYSVPILGFLFGQTNKTAERRELVVVLTPRVIASDQDVEAATRDFKGKLKGLEYRF
jgi:general secretion pathway protein D